MSDSPLIKSMKEGHFELAEEIYPYAWGIGYKHGVSCGRKELAREIRRALHTGKDIEEILINEIRR